MGIARVQTLQITGTYIKSAREVGQRMSPALFASFVTLVFLQSGQGRELVRISSEENHSPLFQLFLISIPAVYTFVVLFIGLSFTIGDKFRRNQVSVGYIYRHNLLSLLCAVALPVVLICFFPFTGFQFFCGATLFLLSFALTRFISAKTIEADSLASFAPQLVKYTLIALTFYEIGLVWVLISQPQIASAIGALGVVVIALTIWVAVIMTVFGMLPVRFGMTTKYSFSLILIVLLLVFSKPEKLQFDSVIQRADRMYNEGDRRNTWWSVAKVEKLPEANRRWYNAERRYHYASHIGNQLQLLADQSKNQIDPVSVYLVSAEGGGIRAAVWTASVLARLDAESNGSITNNTLAYSGVSGGSLGVAVFLSCTENQQEINPKRNIQTCTDQALSKDFLAPGVARILLTEPLRALPFIGGFFKSRDRAFEEVIEASVEIPEISNRLAGPISSITTGTLAAAFQSRVLSIPQFTAPPLADDLPPIPDPIVPGAIAIFNATDAWTGNRVVFSNVAGLEKSRGAFSPYYRIDGVTLLARESAGVPVSFAVHASARFPLFSPPGVYKNMALVDGGYRENTGTEELVPIIETIRSLQKFTPHNSTNESDQRLRSLLDRLSIKVVAITNSSYSSKQPGLNKPSDLARAKEEKVSSGIEAAAPIAAILSSRDVRSADTFAQLNSVVRRQVDMGFEECVRSPTRVNRGDYADATFTRSDGKKMLVKICNERPLQDELHEVALADFVPDSLPVLGWVLANSTFKGISSQFPIRAEIDLRTKLQPSWWHYFQKHFCSIDSHDSSALEAKKSWHRYCAANMKDK